MKKLYTIGFTKKNAETFFGLLKQANVRTVLDIRLNNTSQLAGFAKRDDLKFFLKSLCQSDYLPVPKFAPTKPILDALKKNKGDWHEYEISFSKLIQIRKIETEPSTEKIDHACLLCSEATPEHCHRRLVAEYLQKTLGEIEIIHL